MARRRRPPEPAGPGALPPRLRECVVEDWVRPTERPSDQVWNRTTIRSAETGIRGGEGTTLPVDNIPAQVEFYFELRALRRWQAARAEWAEEHGLSPRELTGRYGTGRPRWRLPPS